MPPLDNLIQCIVYIKPKCVFCDPMVNSKFECAPITADQKLVEFTTNSNLSQIDYNSYLNSGIRMILEPTKVTFYSCFKDITYFQVNRKTYFPIENRMFATKRIRMRRSIGKLNSTIFQTCLETYCKQVHNHRLGCYDPFLVSLDFQFNNAITSLCLQGITFAHILSDQITELRSNSFLSEMNNLVYLKIDLPNLHFFYCNTFMHLRNLRLMDFYVKLSTNITCLFKHNPNIVRIEFMNEIAWNSCEPKGDVTDDDQQTVVQLQTTVKFVTKECDSCGPQYNLIFIYVYIITLLLISISFTLTIVHYSGLCVRSEVTSMPQNRY